MPVPEPTITDIYDEYCVLILEESETLCQLFERWLSPIRVRCVQSLDEFRAQLDSTVAVACLSESVLGDEITRTRKDLLNMNPYCQLVLLQSRGGFVTIHEDDYDACLQRPVFEEGLQETLERHLTFGIYSVLLREFYVLNAKLILFDRNDGDALETTTDPNTLYERQQRVQAKLERLQQNMSSENVVEIMRSIDLHKRYLTSPVREELDKGESKYHPKRCPSCKLPWGVDHGNDLQSGFNRVAANVWKCTRCNELAHGLGESHRRITNQ